MYQRGMTIADAAREWVKEFDAIPQGMIAKLMKFDIDDWHEITKPCDTDRVYVCELPNETPDGKPYNGTKNTGEITDCYDNETYRVRMDDGNSILVKAEDFEVEHDTWLPMWGTMWSFHESFDNDWLENGGIAEMSRCGFRIFESNEFGYFFGIDGVGYDFYGAHWIPLYQARGLHWHDENREKEGWRMAEEYFSEVHWSNENLRNALEVNDVEPTEKLVNQLRRLCESNKFEETMIGAGWDIIYGYINGGQLNTTRFSEDEITHAAVRLCMDRERTIVLLRNWDNGCGDVDDVIDRYEDGPDM